MAALSTGPLFGGIAGDYITAERGWRWTQWTNVIIGSILFVLMLLLQPETLFDRQAALRATNKSSRGADSTSDFATTTEEQKNGFVSETTADGADRHVARFEPYTYVRSLKIGTYRGEWVRHFISPFLTLRLPGVWVVMLQFGGLVGGIVTVSTVGPQVLAAPPYLWGKHVGLINVGGVIGCLIGAVVTYFIADRMTKRQAAKALNGFSEPEARLPGMVPGLFAGAIGLLIFGFAAQTTTPHAWVGMQFGIGLVTFGVMQVPSIGFNYVRIQPLFHPRD